MRVCLLDAHPVPQACMWGIQVSRSIPVPGPHTPTQASLAWTCCLQPLRRDWGNMIPDSSRSSCTDVHGETGGGSPARLPQHQGPARVRAPGAMPQSHRETFITTSSSLCFLCFSPEDVLTPSWLTEMTAWRWLSALLPSWHTRVLAHSGAWPTGEEKPWRQKATPGAEALRPQTAMCALWLCLS